jgi:hypothetical protein
MAAGFEPRTTGSFVTALLSNGKPLKQMKREGSTIGWVMTRSATGLVSQESALEQTKLGLYSSLARSLEEMHP